MEVFWVIIVAVGAYVWVRSKISARGAKRPRSAVRPTAQRFEHPEWLRERWALADRLRGTDSELFPGWYYDAMTEAQARRLDEDGRRYSRSTTKGQASDLIGLGESASAEDLVVLRFFKRSTRGMNQTRARHEVKIIFSEEANRKAWKERPMDAKQREFFRFFGVKVRAGMGHKEAEELSDSIYREASDSEDPRAAHWSVYEQVLDDLEDSEFREGYSLKKPSASAVRKALYALLADGTPLDEVHSDLVVERLLEMNPDLER